MRWELCWQGFERPDGAERAEVGAVSAANGPLQAGASQMRSHHCALPICPRPLMQPFENW